MTSEPSPNAAARPGSIPWPPLLLVGAIGSAFALQQALPLRWPGMDDLPARSIGLGLGIAGVILLVWSVMTLVHHRTTVLPHRGASVLVTSGPYRRFRNPIYLGDVLLLLGLAELTKNVWLVIAAVFFALLVTKLAIEPEEKHLEAKFGDSWRAYVAHSRRWI